MFLGFAHENSATNACLFAQILCSDLNSCSSEMSQMKSQTDNGHEFIGWLRQDRTRDDFEWVVEALPLVCRMEDEARATDQEQPIELPQL